MTLQFKIGQDRSPSLPANDSRDRSTNTEIAGLVLPHLVLEREGLPFPTYDDIAKFYICADNMVYKLSGVHQFSFHSKFRSDVSANMLRFRRIEAVHQIVYRYLESPTHPPTFVPSRHLIDLVRKGLKSEAYLLEADERNVSDDTIGKLLVDRVPIIFATMADFLRQRELSSFPLTKEGCFSDTVDRGIHEQIPLYTRDVAEFSDELYRCVIQLMQDGGQLAGGWGEIRLQAGGDLWLEVFGEPTALARRGRKVKLTTVQV